MPQNSNKSSRIGTPRLVIGLCTLAVGVLLMARDVWLGFFYWPQFRAPERIRFVFLLWAGAVLATAGCWLAFRLRVAGWACVIILALFGVLVYSYGRWWS